MSKISWSNMAILIILFVSIISVFTCPAAKADIKLPSIFGDNMVLQRDCQDNIWGLADPGEFITVIIGEDKVGTTADAKGCWILKLKPHAAGGPVAVTVRGKNIIVLKNVLFGDTWLCSGQSNMLVPLKLAKHTDEDLATTNHPDMRLYLQPITISQDPLFDNHGSWVVCSPEVAKKFSAVGYFFGREMLEKTHVPTGLIQASRGGSSMQTWISRETLAKSNEFQDLLDEHKTKFAQLKSMEDALAKMDKDAEPDKYRELQDKYNDIRTRTVTATCAYNGLIAPIIPFTLKGVLWYQGENDIIENLRFKKLFSMFLQDWRRQFDQPKLPIIFVQIPNVFNRKKDPEESYYAELREVQTEISQLPYTYMIVTIDTAHGDQVPIHPFEKKPVGERLALVALATLYHMPVEWQGPLYDTMEIEGNKILVHFRYAQPHLVAKGPAPIGFEVAGRDKKYEWAKAEIQGDNVVVWSDKVPQPIAVRYAWADNPLCNLYNVAGLPACPFRTDKWPHRRPK